MSCHTCPQSPSLQEAGAFICPASPLGPYPLDPLLECPQIHLMCMQAAQIMCHTRCLVSRLHLWFCHFLHIHILQAPYTCPSLGAQNIRHRGGFASHQAWSEPFARGERRFQFSGRVHGGSRGWAWFKARERYCYSGQLAPNEVAPVTISRKPCSAGNKCLHQALKGSRLSLFDTKFESVKPGSGMTAVGIRRHETARLISTHVAAHISRTVLLLSAFSWTTPVSFWQE